MCIRDRVEGFQRGDRVSTRLPIAKIGAFAEYVAVEQDAIAKMPEGMISILLLPFR